MTCFQVYKASDTARALLSQALTSADLDLDRILPWRTSVNSVIKWHCRAHRFLWYRPIDDVVGYRVTVDDGMYRAVDIVDIQVVVRNGGTMSSVFRVRPRIHGLRVSRFT